MGNSHAHHHAPHGDRDQFPTAIGGDMTAALMPTGTGTGTGDADVDAQIVKESLSASLSAERRNSVPLLGMRGILARSLPSSKDVEPIERSTTPPPVLPSASMPPPAAPLASPQFSSSSSSSSSSSTSSASSSPNGMLPPLPPTSSSPATAAGWSGVRRMPRVRSLAKKASSTSSRGLCSLKRRIARQKTMKVTPSPCQVCPAERCHFGPCSISPIQAVCSDAFSHIFGFLSIPEVCAVTRVSRNVQAEVDNSLAHMQDASFLAQKNSVKLDLFAENQMILKTLSEKCPRVRRLKSQTYVRLSREQCHVLLSGCPRIQQISPSIEFQAADIVSVGQRFPDLTEARVHFSTVSEGYEFGAVCPSIRSLLIDSDNDQIGEIAAVLGERLPRFKFLSVDLCARSVPRAGVDKIPEKLTLALSVVGNIQKEHCVTLTKCRSNLVTLHLHHIPTSDFPVEGLRYLSRHMRSLKELDLPHTMVSMIRPLDNEISQVLSDPKGFPALKRLYLKRYSTTFQAILSKSKTHVKLGRRSCS